MRTYSELAELESFAERFEYLALQGRVGYETFGHARGMNQRFYGSYSWKRLRNHIIVRDFGCDLAVEGYEIHDKLYIHHMNPVTKEGLVRGDSEIMDPEFLITVSHRTHNAIHYGNPIEAPEPFVERSPNDMQPWKRG